MISFKKQKKIFTIISNARIAFAEPALSGGGLKTIASFDLDEFIQGSNAAHVCDIISACHSELLIVPDFWLGIKPLLISSHKRAVVEPLIKRKLKSEVSDVPQAENFFDYVRSKDEQGREGVQVYHFLEPMFAQLHQRLTDCGLQPDRITSPGLLWEKSLAGRISGFEDSGIFLVNIVGAECFFYFYHRGRYLFSRDISFSEQLPAEELIDALSFEIDQSRFLFSQKAKAEIDRIYLVSGQHGADARLLAERLGKETVELAAETWTDAGRISEDLGALIHFNQKELSASGQSLNLAHRLLRQESEWRPVQNTGLAVGICLLLLLIGQTLFLQFGPPARWQAPDPGQQAEQRQILRGFNANLDLAAQEAKRLKITETIGKLARALPEDVRLEQLSIQAEPAPLMTLEGFVRATGAEQFYTVLSSLKEAIQAHLTDGTPLKAADVEFGSVEEADVNPYGTYHVKLRFNLP